MEENKEVVIEEEIHEVEDGAFFGITEEEMVEEKTTESEGE